MSMLPVNYKNVLIKARSVLSKAQKHLQKTDENGRIIPFILLNDIQDEIVNTSEEIGRLDIYISQLKNSAEYVKAKSELEEVRESLLKIKP